MNHPAQFESQFANKTEFGVYLSNDPKRSLPCPFFEIISDVALSALTGKAKTISYPKHASIISADNEVDAFYIILSGKVRVFVSDATGKELTLYFQEPGTYFGEVALLSHQTLSKSIKTVQKTVCAVISKDDFLIWLLNYPEVAFILLSVLAQKIDYLTCKVKQMSLLDTYGRIVVILEALAVVEGEVRVIYNKPSQQTLASMVGASRETVNKLMSCLIKGGYVGIKNKQMVINQKLPPIW